MSYQITPINLIELKKKYQGTRFCQLIEHHLRRQSQDQRIRGIRGTISILPQSVHNLIDDFIGRWNIRANEEVFWQQDTAVVFEEIINDARDVLRPLGLASDDEAVFNLFNIVILNYASSAYYQPKMRQFMRISVNGFPWPSTLALLYPISGTIYFALNTPASLLMVVGYGMASLGYLLFGAGIVAGTFRIFGLRKRWHVIAAAIGAFVMGTVLTNVGN